MADIAIVIKSDTMQAEKDFQSLAGSTEKLKKEIEDFQKSFKPEAIDEFIAKNKLAALGISQTQGPLKGLTAETKGYEKEIRKLISSGLSPQSAEIQKLQAEYVRAGGKLEVLKEQTKKANNATRQHNSSFASGVKNIMAYAAAYVSLRGVVNVFKGIITEARKLEDAEAAFTPLIGGAAKAKELVKQLNIAAAETPFQFEGIQKTVSTLLPVMNGDIQKTVSTFKMLGDTAGGNQQKLESVTRGFTKAMLKGKVDMESLNMIAEAGVPIFTEMATSMGYGEKNMGAFFKEISTGKVSTDTLIEAFKKMTSEGGRFYHGMIISSRTTSGVLSELSDNIKMTGAGIGQAFLPYIKEAALEIIKVSSSVLKWVSAGDNLNNLLKVVGYSLAGLTSAFLAYNIATKASAAVLKIMEIAQKGLNTAMKANLIGAIAAIVMTVLVPAIIALVKNWDLVKYKVVDFGLAAKEKMLELGLAIREKVMGAIIALLNKMSDLPVVGEMFKKIADSEQQITEATKLNIKIVQAQRAINKSAYEATEAERQKSIESNNAEATAIEEANNRKIESYNKYSENMRSALDLITETENMKRIKDIDEAMKFFEQRAEMEGTDFESRMEYLQEQQNAILEIEGITAEQRINMQAGITKAIENENKKRIKTYAQFGSQFLGQTSNLLTDLQAVLANAGKESRKLAVIMKAVAIAQAMVNTFLGVTGALTILPPPVGWAMAAITMAAGLAAVARIVTTPIPSGETGLTYTVPDIPSNRNDKAAVNASAGEKVTVTPRGENDDKTTMIDIRIEEDTIFSVVQRGFDTGKLTFNNKNIRGGVFA